MVSDAEKYKEEDEAAAERITARNALESYAYNLRNSIQDDKLKAQWDANGGDKATLQTAVDEAIQFVESSSEASKAEYEERQKELEAVANPIMTRLHSGGAGAEAGGAPGGGAAGQEHDGPSVEGESNSSSHSRILSLTFLSRRL